MVCLFGFTLNIVQAFETTWIQLVSFYVSTTLLGPKRLREMSHFPMNPVIPAESVLIGKSACTEVVQCGLLHVDRVSFGNGPRLHDNRWYLRCHTGRTLDCQHTG